MQGVTWRCPLLLLVLSGGLRMRGLCTSAPGRGVNPTSGDVRCSPYEPLGSRFLTSVISFSYLMDYWRIKRDSICEGVLCAPKQT